MKLVIPDAELPNIWKLFIYDTVPYYWKPRNHKPLCDMCNNLRHNYCTAYEDNSINHGVHVLKSDILDCYFFVCMEFVNKYRGKL